MINAQRQKTKFTIIQPEGGMYLLTVMGEQPSPERASISMAASRGRASAHEVKGGSKGIRYVLAEKGLEEVEMVRAERSMAVRVAFRAEKGDTL